jgi:hypothetical protein
MIDKSVGDSNSYLNWIVLFLLFHPERLPYNCSEAEVASFLEYLALKRKVTRATQAQALKKQRVGYITVCCGTVYMPSALPSSR